MRIASGIVSVHGKKPKYGTPWEFVIPAQQGAAGPIPMNLEELRDLLKLLIRLAANSYIKLLRKPE